MMNCSNLKKGGDARPAPFYSSYILVNTRGKNRFPRGGSGSRLTDVHLDLLWLGFLALGNVEREHAIFVVSLNGLGVDGVGQREAASEGAIAALDTQIILLFGLFTRACRAGDLLELAL